MLKKYNQFLNLINEFNNQDKALIKSLDEYFTVAIEYEICANEDPQEEPPIEDEEKAIQNAVDQTLLDLARGKTIGLYMFSDTKWTEKVFKDNEEKMLSENPKYSTLSKSKRKALNLKYKTWTWLNDFISELSELVDFDDEYDTMDDLEAVECKDELEQIVLNRFTYNVHEFCFSQNMEYLIGRVEEKLPNFWKNWGSTFKFELEGDDDKQRILEMSPKTYVSGLSNAIKQIEDFYNDFEKQDFWYLNNRTALHINVGVSSKVKWNPIKGILLMSDFNREGRKGLPYIFKGIEWRSQSRFAGSLLDTLLDDLKNSNIYYKDGQATDKASEKITAEIERLKLVLKSTKGKENKKVIQDQIDNIRRGNWNLEFRKKDNIIKNREEFLSKVDTKLESVSDFEDTINEFLIKNNSDYYQKEFGLKLTEIKNNYVEFRYIGSKADGLVGGIDKNLFIDKLYYFCYIVYAMTDKDFKRKDYLNKLYKFTQELKEAIDGKDETKIKLNEGTELDEFNTWLSGPAYNSTLKLLNDKDIDYTKWSDIDIYYWYTKNHDVQVEPIHVEFWSHSPFGDGKSSAGDIYVTSISDMDDTLNEFNDNHNEYMNTHRDDPDMPPDYSAVIYITDDTQ